MELRQLDDFVAIAREGGFRRAADRLGVNESSLSRAIKQLELELRVELFRRGNRTAALPEAGEALLPYAERALAEVQQARERLSTFAGPQHGTVRVATLAAIATPWTPALVADFGRRYPEVRVELVEGRSAALLQTFSEGSIDVAWVLVPDQDGKAPSGIHLERVRSGEMVFIASPSRALAPRSSITLADLAAEPLILPPRGTSMRAIVDQGLQAKGVQLRMGREVGDQITLIQLVSQNLGIGATWSGLIPAGAEVQVLSVQDLTLPCSVCLAWRPTGVRNQAAVAFVRFARRWVAQHLEQTAS